MADGSNFSKGCDIPMSLPVDEEDYLMPSPGLRNSQNYVDLIGDAKLSGNVSAKVSLLVNHDQLILIHIPFVLIQN